MTRETLIVALGDRRYGVERDWAKLPDGQAFGFLSDVAIDSNGIVHVGQRTDTPMMAFGPGGKLLRSWGEGEIADVHGVSATTDGRVLVVDRDAHQLLIYDTKGARQLALGQRHDPQLQAPFNHPTSAASLRTAISMSPTATAIRSSTASAADGRLKRTWGSRGTGPGEFRPRTPCGSIPVTASWSPTGKTIASRSSIATGLISRNGAISTTPWRSMATIAA